MTRRHRPYYVLFLPGRVVSTCDCHLGQTVRFDRPLPAGTR